MWFCFFFFKQKTAYEMRISDWSSDVCSSDLMGAASTQNASGIVPWLNAIDFPYMFQSNGQLYNFFFNPKSEKLFRKVYRDKYRMEMLWGLCEKIGRASCRERVCKYV